MYCPVRYRESSLAQSFAQSWVHVTRARQVFAAGGECDRYRSLIDQIACVRPEDMDAKYAVGFCVSEHFHHALDLAQCACPTIGAEGKDSFSIFGSDLL